MTHAYDSQIRLIDRNSEIVKSSIRAKLPFIKNRKLKGRPTLNTQKNGTKLNTTAPTVSTQFRTDMQRIGCPTVHYWFTSSND